MESSLLNKSLFAKVPPPSSSTISLELFYQDIDADKPLNALIDQTYHLLRNSQLEQEVKLKLWKIRLSLLLFDDCLPVAKREAVNLNNILYDLENPGTVDGSSSRISPLPKNNNGMIDHELILLILRLKSAPNMNLVNEFYKLAYQVRLRSSISDQESLIRRLSRLSFDTIVILVVNKANSTLANLLGSILHELEMCKKSEHYAEHASNITLLWVIARSIMKSTLSKKVDASTFVSNIKLNYSSTFDKLQKPTLATLTTVLSQIAPNTSDSKPLLESDKDIITLNELAQFIERGDITSRIICAMIGIWDLQYCYNFRLEDSKVISPLHEDTDEGLPLIERKVENMWCSNYNRVYGLE